MKLNFLIIFLLTKIYLSDINSSQKSVKNIEKKAKVLACSYLSKIFIDSVQDYDKVFKDLFKDKSLGQNEEETKERISHFMIVNCYKKITKETANKIILDISKGNKDIIKNKEYYNLFEMGKDKDMSKIKETMKEIGEILKEIKEEEEIFKKRKDSPDFEKAYKEFEEKMKKNKDNFKKKTTNEKEQNNKKKKKKSGKKPYEGTKWEVVKPTGENLLNIKDIINNPTLFFEETGINTFCGMCIMALITINIYQNIFNSKKEKESNIKEDNVNEEDIKNINKIEKEEEEEEDEKEEEVIEKNDEEDIKEIKEDNIENEIIKSNNEIKENEVEKLKEQPKNTLENNIII